MNLKKQIAKLIKASGLENKEVVAILDEIRKDYHDRKNVGDKVVSERELSPYMDALIGMEHHPLSKDKSWVFFKGGWRKVYRAVSGDRHIKYLGSFIQVKFKKR
jgi:hypothetical protein